jgi:hypothetical protein
LEAPSAFTAVRFLAVTVAGPVPSTINEHG